VVALGWYGWEMCVHAVVRWCGVVVWVVRRFLSDGDVFRQDERVAARSHELAMYDHYTEGLRKRRGVINRG